MFKWAQGSTLGISFWGNFSDVLNQPGSPQCSSMCQKKCPNSKSCQICVIKIHSIRSLAYDLSSESMRKGQKELKGGRTTRTGDAKIRL